MSDEPVNRRARLAAYLGLALALVIVACVVVALMLRPDRSGAPVAALEPLLPPPTLTQLTRGGAVYDLTEMPPLGAYADPVDAYVLRVAPLGVDGASSDPCAAFGATARLVDEDARTIRIVLYAYLKRPAHDVGQVCTSLSDSSRILPGVPIRLARPVGSRKVIDASSGRHVPILPVN